MNWIEKVSDLLVNHSCKEIKVGSRVIVESIGANEDLLESIIEKITQKGGIPIIWIKSERIIETLARCSSINYYKELASNELSQMKKSKFFIGLRAPRNLYSLDRIASERKKRIFSSYIQPVHFEYRNDNLDWVYFREPTPEWASSMNMDFDEFFTLYTDALFLDYGKLEHEMNGLAKMLQSCKKVAIRHNNGTDLTFSIENIGVYRSVGKRNLPDGEIFTAPVKSSIDGRILFNIDSIYYGSTFTNVELVFKKGKIISARGGADSQTKKLMQVLDTDQGARYIGEFAFGLNPLVERDIGDILFDEKIHGSVHFAIGNSYPEANNGNKSGIHWDLILDNRLNTGGGKVYFDGELIQKNGIFVNEELTNLNVQRLKNQVKM